MSRQINGTLVRFHADQRLRWNRELPTPLDACSEEIVLHGVKLVDLSAFSDLELVDSRSTSRVLSSDVSFVTFGTASKIGLFLNFFKGYSTTKNSKNAAIFFRLRLSRNTHQTKGLDHCKTFSRGNCRRRLCFEQ